MAKVYAVLFCLFLVAGVKGQTPADAMPSTAPTATPAKVPAKPADWAALARYRDDDAQLEAEAPVRGRVVFLGDSITDNWGRGPNHGEFFPGKPYVNRGISGQTTPQMLLRFEQDVVRLHPAVVVILAGTNDIAGNTGPETATMIEDNFRAMTAIAKSNGIRVVLASLLPALHYPWRPGVEAAEPIRSLNEWLRQYASQSGAVYLDYYSALVNDQGGMRAGLSSDGVHPVTAGYALMAPLAENAIREALAMPVKRVHASR